MNITSPLLKFMVLFCHILRIHNIFIMNKNKLAVYFKSGFSFHTESKSYSWCDWESTQPFLNLTEYDITATEIC